MRSVWKVGMSLVALLAAGSLVAAAPAKHPARPARVSHADSVLAAEAKISKEAATATALAKVPGGKVKSSELERERGRLIYSFDIKVPGKPGIEEVNVDAIDGTVVSVDHEGAKAEKREAREDRAEAKRDTAKSARAPAKH